MFLLWISGGTKERADRASSKRSTFSHGLISVDAWVVLAYFTSSLMNEEQPAAIYLLEYACDHVLKCAGAESNIHKKK